MSDDAWQPPPQQLALPSADVVDVWRAPAADRDEARTILRLLLARYLACGPARIAFTTSPEGKPALADPTADLRFNISHTKGLALYAFAQGAEVGIDVERPRTSIDTIRIARRFISPDEADRLQRLDPSQRSQAFIEAWVRYEATVKCLGTGIGGRDIQHAVRQERPWVCDLDPGPQAAAAAVAVAGGPRTLRLYQWEPIPEP